MRPAQTQADGPTCVSRLRVAAARLSVAQLRSHTALACRFWLLIAWAVVSVYSAVGWAQDAPSKKQRIVSSAPVITEILFAVGAGDEVVGVDEYSKYPPEAAKKKSIGALRNLDTEALIALQPTLVVIYGQNPDLEAFCQRRGVAKLNVMIESVDDLYKTIEVLGKATGRGKEAGELAVVLRARLLAVKNNAAEALRQRVLLTIGREAGSFQNVLSVGRGSFLDELVTLAGGQNVFHGLSQPYPMISTEQIIAAQPDIIIELWGEAGEMKDIEQRRRDWQAFKSIPAVKNGRIHFLAGDHLLIPGPRIGKIAEDLARVLHPQESP